MAEDDGWKSRVIDIESSLAIWIAAAEAGMEHFGLWHSDWNTYNYSEWDYGTLHDALCPDNTMVTDLSVIRH